MLLIARPAPVPRFGRTGHETQPRYSLTMPTVDAGTMGWLRTSIGIALLVAPGVPLRLAGTEAPTSAALLLIRTIGIRDLVLGLGVVSAARAPARSDARRWMRATLASDALDTVVSLAALRSIGRRDSLFAAAPALAFVCGDLLALQAAYQPEDEQDQN